MTEKIAGVKVTPTKKSPVAIRVSRVAALGWVDTLVPTHRILSVEAHRGESLMHLAGGDNWIVRENIDQIEAMLNGGQR